LDFIGGPNSRLGDMRQLLRWLVPTFLALTVGLTSYGIQLGNSKPTNLVTVIENYEGGQAEFSVIREMPATNSAFSGPRFEILLESIHISNEVAKVRAFGVLNGKDPSESLAVGAKYRCFMNFAPIQSVNRQIFRASCISGFELLMPAHPGANASKRFRDSFLANLAGISAEAKGLVAGLAIGEKRLLSDEFSVQMKAVGLTHLTAVSGANCAIVVGLVYLVSMRISRRRIVRTVIGVVALVLYVGLVGPEPSVIRSAFMAGVVLVAASLGRPAAGSPALALAVLVLLCIDPWLATDYGFMLSVAATAGILLLTRPLYEKFKSLMPAWIALPLAVSAGAQVMCLPVLLQLQEGLATYSLLANLLVEPMVAPITVLGILSCLVAIPLPGLAVALSWLASVAAQWIVITTQLLSSLAGGVIPWPNGFLGAISAVAVIIALVVFLLASAQQSKNWAAFALLIILGVTIGSAGSAVKRYGTWPNQAWQVVACDVGQGDAFVLRSEGLTAVIDVGRENAPTKECLDRLGVQAIDLLVLTHYDLDHVGGLGGALAGRRIGEVLLSPFPDERWAASNVQETLQATGSRIYRPFEGDSGKLGAFTWTVLNPPRNLNLVEDSNDASLAMLWKGAEFNFLAFADLGERGQMRLGAASSTWLGQGLDNVPMILKVAHHGSRDQFSELYEAVRPDVCLISSGEGNSYGHPTRRTLDLLESLNCETLRTDNLGSISLQINQNDLKLGVSGRG
jgi:competence protein ComEC